MKRQFSIRIGEEIAHFDEIDRHTIEKLGKLYVLESGKSNKRPTRKRYITFYNRKTKGSQFLHRFLLGAVKNQIVDHIDGNSINNVRSNLRLVSRNENSRNQKITHNITGYKGVYQQGYKNKPFYAQIRWGGKQLHLGGFETAQLAAKAYNDAAIKYFGNFAAINEGI